MRLRSLLPVCVAFHLALALPHESRAQFENLLKRVPPQANAIVAIDVSSLYSSPMAASRKWKEKFATNWSDQPIVIPPEANRLLLASHLDPLNNLRADWEVGVMALDEPLSMNSIARAEGGYLDSIDNTQVVWTPSHTYFVQPEKSILGLVYPDDRQAVSRWIAFNQKNKTPLLSPYLKAATERAGRDGQVVMAIDLANVVQPHRLEKSLKNSAVLAGKKIDRNAVAEAIASVRGVTLVVNIRSQAFGAIRVDFGQNIRILEPFAKELLLETIDRFGARLADMKSWQVSVEDDAILFNGSLSDEGLHQVSGLLELPTSKFSTLKKEVENGPPTTNPTAEASQRYFKSLEKLVQELREGLKNPGTNALWLEKSGRKIDAMPILHVDEELLAFGADTAKRLREMAEGVRNIGREVGVAQSQVYGNYYSVGSYADSGYYRSSASTSATIDEQSRAASSSVRTMGMKDVTNGLADIRRKMTKKYSVEF